ncbi:MAG: arsenite efflux transporter metallochaperone ArsD [Eggerthellaceae bacterium]|jgi:hypothetical protein|nr:arsenite efflux transporter metallochaperone ArsD [Eggerthellaceae bacterium]
MKKLEFYEPAMCCDTGLCGPGVDSELLRVVTVIEDISKVGGDVSRHNLKAEPGVFVANEIVAKILKDQGVNSLPITLVDGEVVATGSYPSNERLSRLLGVELSPAPESEAKEASPCRPSEPAQTQTSCCGPTEPASGKSSCCC